MSVPCTDEASPRYRRDGSGKGIAEMYTPARDVALLTPGEQKMFRQDFPPFPAQIRRFMRVGDDLF